MNEWHLIGGFLGVVVVLYVLNRCLPDDHWFKWLTSWASRTVKKTGNENPHSGQ